MSFNLHIVRHHITQVQTFLMNLFYQVVVSLYAQQMNCTISSIVLFDKMHAASSPDVTPMNSSGKLDLSPIFSGMYGWFSYNEPVCRSRSFKIVT